MLASVILMLALIIYESYHIINALMYLDQFIVIMQAHNPPNRIMEPQIAAFFKRFILHKDSSGFQELDTKYPRFRHYLQKFSQSLNSYIENESTGGINPSQAFRHIFNSQNLNNNAGTSQSQSLSQENMNEVSSAIDSARQINGDSLDQFLEQINNHLQPYG